MSATTTASADQPRAPGSLLLWFHVGLYALLGLTGYFAMEALFGTAVLLPSASAAVKWLSAALLILAGLLAAAARSGSPEQIKLAMLGAFLFDLQLPIVIARYPAMVDHLEGDLGLNFRVVMAGLFLFAGVTAYQLSRVWRLAAKPA